MTASGRRRRTPAVVVGMAVGTGCAAVLLVGCSGVSSGTTLPTFSGSSATTTSGVPTSPTASSAPSPSGLPSASTLRTGPLPPSLTAEQRRVAEAFYAYWAFAVASFGTVTLDEARIGSVMTGAALTRVRSSVRRLHDLGHRNVGETRVGVRTVRISGTSATVCATVSDHSVEVDKNGRPVEAPLLGTQLLRGSLVRPGPTWLTKDALRVSRC